jgi:arylsulfatase A-like enzyme
LDEGVGRLIDSLEREGLGHDTLVFFCSDNGATGPGSNKTLNGLKGQLLEGGHRVPAIAWWPGRIAPGESTETAMTMDLFPTLAAVADASIPAGGKIDGVNLLPLLTERMALPERTLFWRTGAARREKAVRQGPWKLREASDGVALYHLEDDLGETIDRARQEPARLAELQTALATWEQDVSGVPVRT